MNITKKETHLNSNECATNQELQQDAKGQSHAQEEAVKMSDAPALTAVAPTTIQSA